MDAIKKKYDIRRKKRQIAGNSQVDIIFKKKNGRKMSLKEITKASKYIYELAEEQHGDSENFDWLVTALTIDGMKTIKSYGVDIMDGYDEYGTRVKKYHLKDRKAELARLTFHY